jgi:hypothetical protein
MIEQLAAAGDYRWRNDEVQLVDEAVLEQRAGHRHACLHSNVPARLACFNRLTSSATSPLTTVVLPHDRSLVLDVSTCFWPPLMKLANGSLSLPGQ